MNQCATRRLKLFDDAKFYGAKIIKNTEWMAAIVNMFDQAHCFGRLKPKTIPGTNDVDPACNLRADEGLTKANKMRQESNDPYVQDGIGFDQQECEAGWNFVGPVSYFGRNSVYKSWGPGLKPCPAFNDKAYRGGKTAGEMCPFIILMDLATGALFATSLTYKNNDWVFADFNTEKNGQYYREFRSELAKNPAFRDIMRKSIASSLKGMHGVPQVFFI